VKRFLVAAALALTIHGLFFGFGPRLLSRQSPPKPMQLAVTFAPRQDTEAGPGPELDHPVPSPDEVMRGFEEKAEPRGVRQDPPEEIPKPPEKAVSPKVEPPKPRPEAGAVVRPRQTEVKSPPKKRILAEKKSVIPPPQVKAQHHPEMKPAPERIPGPVAAAGPTQIPSMERGAGKPTGSRPNVPGPSGTVGPEAGEKAGPVPSTEETTQATPAYRKNPRPEYPRMAKRRGYQGTVLLEVLVNKAGKVNDLRILQSSGYRILDRSALQSVKTWLFEPGSIGDQKVDMWVRVPVRFELKER